MIYHQIVMILVFNTTNITKIVWPESAFTKSTKTMTPLTLCKRLQERHKDSHETLEESIKPSALQTVVDHICRP